MKVRHAPISVSLVQNRLTQIEWRNHIYIVQRISDAWIARSRWWSVDEKRFYVRVQTDQGMMEAYRRDSEWYISGIFD